MKGATEVATTTEIDENGVEVRTTYMMKEIKVE